jgi:hypothetical protein
MGIVFLQAGHSASLERFSCSGTKKKKGLSDFLDSLAWEKKKFIV